VIGLRPTLFVSAIGSTLVFLPLLAHPIRKLTAMPQSPGVEPALADA
jgi:hypothetical protein